MLGSECNCNLQVGSVPEINPNVVENKTSFTSVLLCSSIIDPPQHSTTISKYDSGASNNYWRTEYQIVLTDIKDTHNGPIVQLPNNATRNSTKTENTPLSGNLRLHKNAHIFDVLHSDLLTSLGQLCDNDCITILDKNRINILKYSKKILKGHKNKSDGL